GRVPAPSGSDRARHRDRPEAPPRHRSRIPPAPPRGVLGPQPTPWAPPRRPRPFWDRWCGPVRSLRRRHTKPPPARPCGRAHWLSGKTFLGLQLLPISLLVTHRLQALAALVLVDLLFASF